MRQRGVQASLAQLEASASEENPMKFKLRLLRKLVVTVLLAPVLIVGPAACGDKDERTPTPQTLLSLR